MLPFSRGGAADDDARKTRMLKPTAADADSTAAGLGGTSAESPTAAAAIRQHLHEVLESHLFRASERCRRFLAYVVERKLAGECELLKERLIGSEVFNRAPDYDTSDDPIVRVAASEVRRRLIQYYAEAGPGNGGLRLELPLGSYRPIFRRDATGIAQQATGVPPASGAEASAAGSASARSAAAASTPPAGSAPAGSATWRVSRKVGLAAGLIAVALLSYGFVAHRYSRQTADVLTAFWGPVLTSQQPLLICIPSPVVYQPDLDLYRRSPRFSSTYATQLDRTRHALEFPPGTLVPWSDIATFADFYVTAGDAYAAAQLDGLMNRLHKPVQVRTGANWSLADLRQSPAVLIGAFDDDLALSFTSQLPFRWVERDDRGMIEETDKGGRLWGQHWFAGQPIDTDYALITRLLDATTGQFVILIGGIGPYGTEAAGNLVSDAPALQEALAGAPRDWQDHNLEILLRAHIAQGVVEPAQVVALRVW